jgi:hypothetical protein
MPYFDYQCSKCGDIHEELIKDIRIMLPVGEIDKNIICILCNSPCIRKFSIVPGMSGNAEPWEYSYTHKVKPKFVKDSQGNKIKFNPNGTHQKGRKGSGQ